MSEIRIIGRNGAVYITSESVAKNHTLSHLIDIGPLGALGYGGARFELQIIGPFNDPSEENRLRDELKEMTEQSGAYFEAMQGTIRERREAQQQLKYEKDSRAAAIKTLDAVVKHNDHLSAEIARLKNITLDVKPIPMEPVDAVLQEQVREMWTPAVKQRAYALDPECWVSYSGKPCSVKRAIEARRIASLQLAKAQLDPALGG